MIDTVSYLAIGAVLGSFITFVMARPRSDDAIEDARCRACGRLWDEHTSLGACPDASGRRYNGPKPWER